MITAERLVIVFAAAIAVLLQILLAPHIAIGYAVPNFVLVCCAATRLMRQMESGPVFPFVLGLIFDLVSGGPVGAMALSLTIAVTLESWLFERVNNDTMFMAIAVMAFCVFLAELLYGMIILLFGFASGLPETFVYRILPCFLYDFILSVVLYLVLSRIFSGGSVQNTEIKQL